MGNKIPYWGRFLLFMELPWSFCPHLDNKWDITCKILNITVKLARPYYTSTYFSHIKALLSNYIRFINTYIRSKPAFWRSDQFIHFDHILVGRLSTYLGHYCISITIIMTCYIKIKFYLSIYEHMICWI